MGDEPTTDEKMKSCKSHSAQRIFVEIPYGRVGHAGRMNMSFLEGTRHGSASRAGGVKMASGRMERTTPSRAPCFPRRKR